ncbi:unnamed protein product [Lactuca virosa]|uniref:Uncharacterized protein n=1 Tax=Lactuca virosa TaxID=75947 RepID=A0AAU9NEI2_9ASTR|nr:unnamed protein product [Lactuca virosa]
MADSCSTQVALRKSDYPLFSIYRQSGQIESLILDNDVKHVMEMRPNGYFGNRWTGIAKVAPGRKKISDLCLVYLTKFMLLSIFFLGPISGISKELIRMYWC